MNRHSEQIYIGVQINMSQDEKVKTSRCLLFAQNVIRLENYWKRQENEASVVVMSNWKLYLPIVCLCGSYGREALR